MHKKFVQSLESHFEGYSLKEIQNQLSEILNIGTSSVYNKLKGRSLFTFEEICTLCSGLGIDINNFAPSDNDRTIESRFIIDGSGDMRSCNYETYLSQITAYANFVNNNDFQKAVFVNGQTHLFSVIDYPHLLYLKFFIYNMINWKDSRKSLYHPETVIHSEVYNENRDYVKNTYHRMPRMEILSYNYLASTRMQIEYLAHNGVLKKAQLDSLVTELERFVIDLEDSLVNPEHLADIYVNQVIRISNLTLVYGQRSFCALQLDVPHVIRSFDSRLVDHLTNWVQSVKDFSTLITQSSGFQRQAFLSELNTEIRRVKEVSIL